MLDPSSLVPQTDWLRLGLVYAHVLLCGFALVQVLQADVRIATGRFTVAELRLTAHRTALTLAALWISGLLIIYLDTGLDPAVLASAPKLLLKLFTVLVLTVNGVLLHFLSFPIIAGRARPSMPQSLLLAITGALSTSHWLLAAFVGVARPLGQWPFELLVRGYVAYVAATLLVALASAPALRKLLTPRRSDDRGPAPWFYNVELDVLLLPDSTGSHRTHAS